MNAPLLQMPPSTARHVRLSAFDGGPLAPWAAHDTAMPATDTIDLWLFDLNADIASAADTAPRNLARRMTARRRLRQVLCGALGCTDDALELVVGARGKPGLRAPRTPPLCFNMSRSGSLALIAIGAVEIGIDIETILRPRSSCEPNADPIERLRRWTRREAVAKATGLGLTMRFRSPLATESGSVQLGGSFWAWRDVVLPADAHAVATIAYRERGQRRCG